MKIYDTPESKLYDKKPAAKGKISANITFWVAVCLIINRFFPGFLMPLESKEIQIAYTLLLMIALLIGVFAGIYSLVKTIKTGNRKQETGNRKYMFMAIFGLSINLFIIGFSTYQVLHLVIRTS